MGEGAAETDGPPAIRDRVWTEGRHPMAYRVGPPDNRPILWAPDSFQLLSISLTFVVGSMFGYKHVVVCKL